MLTSLMAERRKPVLTEHLSCSDSVKLAWSYHQSLTWVLILPFRGKYKKKKKHNTKILTQMKVKLFFYANLLVRAGVKL